MRKYRNIGATNSLLLSLAKTKELFSDWTETGERLELISITYGHDLFVALSMDFPNYLYTSKDGIIWSKINVIDPYGGSGDKWEDICFGNGKFICVLDQYYQGKNRVLTSSNGIDWSFVLCPDGYYSYSVAYGNGKFISVGRKDLSAKLCTMVSSDGINWEVYENDDSRLTYPSELYRPKISYANGIFIITGRHDIGYNVLTSSDGITWTLRSVSYNGNYYSEVVYGNGVYVCISSGYKNGGSTFYSIMLSTNTVYWEPIKIDFKSYDYFTSIIFYNGLFIAVTHSGQIITSTNGRNWNILKRTLVDSTRIIAKNGIFVAVGDIIRSAKIK